MERKIAFFMANVIILMILRKNHDKNNEFKAPNRIEYPFEARFTRFRPYRSQKNATATPFSTIYFWLKYLRLPYKQRNKPRINGS